MKNKEEYIKVFVYGTLKKEFWNHHVLEMNRAIFVDEVRSTDLYPMFKLTEEYPYLSNVKGTGKFVIGEMYKVKEVFIKNLDKFEGVPYLYERGTIEVVDSENTKHECLCYFISKSKEHSLDNVVFISEFLD